MAAQAPTTTSAEAANPRAWRHAVLGGLAVFLALTLGASLAGMPFSAMAPLGGFAGSAAAAVLAERSTSHWPWYAYVLMPVGTVGVLETLLTAAH